MKQGVLLVVLVLSLSSLTFGWHDSTRYGILYVNEIIANSDTRTVQIDGSFVEDNIIRLDVMEEWNGNGIHVEGVFLKDKNAFLGADFVVHPDTYLPQDWNLFFNGGLVADSPLEDLFSFWIEDDTGRTSIRGLLVPGRGIDVGNGAFIVEDNSGETTIRDALLNANGGINVNNGNFTVAKEDGSVFANNYIHIDGTVYLGNSSTMDRRISRVDTEDKFGGITFFGAQNGSRSGGDLYLIPGSGSQQSGNIFFGRTQGDNIIVHRDIEFSTQAAGTTILAGQDATLGNGGNIIISGGKSVANGRGGDVILAPGTTFEDDDDNTVQGRLLFGTDIQNLSDFDLSLERPALRRGNGGDTFLIGQNSQNGNAGNLTLRAGTVRDNGDGIGGDLRIEPGLDADENQADIIIGNGRSANLFLTRYVIPSQGGDTYWMGQDSSEGDGGDLHLQAGDSRSNGNGGSIHIVPGTTPVNPAGHIYFGSPLDVVNIGREPSNGGGMDTYMIGQASQASTGGDYFIISGQGSTDAGDMFISAGAGGTGSGGDISVTAGNGGLNGGSIGILAGDSNGEFGGDVRISAGDGDTARGGNIYFNSGSADLLGSVIVQQPTNQVYIDTMPVVIRNSFFEMQHGSDSVVIRADPDRLVEFNGKQIVRNTSHYPILYSSTGITAINQYTVAKSIQHGFNHLVSVLGQCQHGLIQVANLNGDVDCSSF